MTTAISENDMAKVVTMRDAIAARIKDLSNRWAENTIALGREFKRARDSFPEERGNHRPGWHDWIERNTGWQAKHATSFIRIAEKFGARSVGTTGLSWKVLDFLSRPETPEQATKEVMRLAKKGEVVGLGRAEEIVEERKPRPKPSEANKQAKETGKAILASDNNYYFGASKEQAAEYERKLQIVYGVRRAIETLAAVGMTAPAFLKYADKHQLWRANEEHLLTEAHDWLSALLEAWENR